MDMLDFWLQYQAYYCIEFGGSSPTATMSKKPHLSLTNPSDIMLLDKGPER